MCTASQTVQGVMFENARQGEDAMLHRFAGGMIALVNPHPKGRVPRDGCCVRTGTQLLLSQISPAFQAEFGVQSIALVTFSEQPHQRPELADAVLLGSSESQTRVSLARLYELSPGTRIHVAALRGKSLDAWTRGQLFCLAETARKASKPAEREIEVPAGVLASRPGARVLAHAGA